MAVKRASERRSDFVAAARDLFEEKGFENTSVDDIVARLGVAKGLFYYYFDSKEMLLDLILEHMLMEIESAIAASMEKKGLNAIERLGELIKCGADITFRSRTIIRYFQKERNRSLHLSIEKKSLEMMLPALERIVRQGNEEKVFDAPYPREAAGAMLFIISGMRALMPEDPSAEDMLRYNKTMQLYSERILGAAPGSLRVYEEMLPPELRRRKGD
ncbi:MAG: TetR/AcrR family transcriptional regulator [Methanomassiliicoccaceae archaeon]|jgi:AcrR family transcriptional regulator|nr:TetR/AcrR family transcriptional regulator [Euryarchaeota archaeon]HOB37434.1 TetR/AcrR family transcriptional regulator [Methanomassiliicoccaceae archaeon]HOQ26246.1 TetR/AcrR family transcriptional regulator [Methanomassiliicoccaceae archaeon]HPP45185.1 TetR/AcrR family transcriptional regulator [Methanomassiliicoccaceae archaeon]HQA21603.1 TetR/AcrR family transcriptional regulator [Methanomassiliicoccaceae archaeon]